MSKKTTTKKINVKTTIYVAILLLVNITVFGCGFWFAKNNDHKNQKLENEDNIIVYDRSDERATPFNVMRELKPTIIIFEKVTVTEMNKSKFALDGVQYVLKSKIKFSNFIFTYDKDKKIDNKKLPRTIVTPLEFFDENYIMSFIQSRRLLLKANLIFRTDIYDDNNPDKILGTMIGFYGI